MIIITMIMIILLFYSPRNDTVREKIYPSLTIPDVVRSIVNEKNTNIQKLTA